MALLRVQGEMMVGEQGPVNDTPQEVPEIVPCPHCGFENLPNSNYCGRCGLSIFDSESLEEEHHEPLPMGMGVQEEPTKGRLPSPIYIIGFGAVLAIASVAYPWYIIGDPAEVIENPVSLRQQLDSGWDLFPGVPLMLITLSASMSTFLAILANNGRSYPVVSILTGLLTLVSATWLWSGVVVNSASTSDTELTPMLATVGAIILMVGATTAALPLLRR